MMWAKVVAVLRIQLVLNLGLLVGAMKYQQLEMRTFDALNLGTTIVNLSLRYSCLVR